MTATHAAPDGDPVNAAQMIAGTTDAPLLVVRGLTKVYRSTSGWASGRHTVRAVDHVSFEVGQRETFGLVGESGCGKSTVARCVLNLVQPTAGDVYFDGRNLQQLARREMRAVRRELQVVFQDPYSSLDPRMSVRATLLEPLEIHRVGARVGRERRAAQLLEMVGLPASALRRFPHEFSGGQRQRIGIARALALSPRMIVADEPVSALDLSVRAQVINLMLDLQREFGLAYLFIAHDLALVRQICQRVAVMYQGKLVEIAPADRLFAAPRHAYTRRLLAAIPEPDPTARHRRSSDPAGQPSLALPEPTELRQVEPGHWVRQPVAQAGEAEDLS
jgi:ABC-type oligopeptide transport system ATPase subunit